MINTLTYVHCQPCPNKAGLFYYDSLKRFCLYVLERI
nr:MAG TPA: hypothetical protein [Caudoviricetes sp.]